ncbi:kinase-like domain-containing protein [Kalaharituber pfeilii]|nr:kinase-like domain-containing protein [Kalaharituber pfeilii]
MGNASDIVAVDIWLVGCILAELLGGVVLFKGIDSISQIRVIIDVLGIPTEEDLAETCSPDCAMYLRTLPFTPEIPISEQYPYAQSEVLEILQNLLKFSPAKRAQLHNLLRLPYFAEWRSQCASYYEKFCPRMVDKDYEKIDDLTKIEIWIELEAKHSPSSIFQAEDICSECAYEEEEAELHDFHAYKGELYDGDRRMDLGLQSTILDL